MLAGGRDSYRCFVEINQGPWWVFSSNWVELVLIVQAEPLLVWLRQTVTDYEAFIVAAR